MPETKDVLIRVRNLKTYYPVKQGVFKHTVGHVKAVDDVSLDVYRGEILGVVGESGCGKTTLGKSILQLIKPTEGSIRYAFEGGEKELVGMNKKELDEARCKMQIVFQDPYSSLNPSFTIFGSMQEPLIRFGEKSRKARREKIAKLLEAVNLPADYMERYPNEFSGGQRQRIGIARALSVSPEFIVCDEAVSALDVSIQAQVLQLLKKLQEERGLTYMFITHDMGSIATMADRVIVMYAGRCVESGTAEDILLDPRHPYTQGLIACIPHLCRDGGKRSAPLQEIPGMVPSIRDIGPGCAFAKPDCFAERPPFTTSGGRGTACFRAAPSERSLP